MVPEGSARVLIKLEYVNPTGSMRDRMALAMVETARKLAEAPGSYWTDQLNNIDQLSSHDRMGGEIWGQTQGHVSALVQNLGTAGSLRGIAAHLRGHDEGVQIVAVEPEESAVLSGRQSGSHKIEGELG